MRIFTVLAVVCLGAVANCQTRSISVTLDGRLVQFPDTKPLMMGEHVVIPLRGLIKEMGAQVQWRPNEREVWVNSPGKAIRLMLGEPKALVNGEALVLERGAVLVNGRTMVPLRFVAEALGAGVTWRPNENTVVITTRS